MQQNHTIRSIHPIQLKTVFNTLKEKEEETLKQSKEHIDNNISEYIENFCQKICEFMKKRYLNQYYDIVNEEISSFKVNNVQ